MASVSRTAEQIEASAPMPMPTPAPLPPVPVSRFVEQRVAGKIARGFTIATGETPLITTIQSLASALGGDELLRSAERAAAGTLPKREATRLAAAGIDLPMLQRIGTMGTQHGEEANGLRFGHSDLWGDQKAAQAFEAAILKGAHAMSLRPGVGDIPLAMSHELGKLLLQFKSFAFAASRHVLMPIAQGVARGDVRAMSGLLSLLVTGYASYWAKQRESGQPVETDNPGRIALEVLDKSNLLGWTGEAIFPGLRQLGFKDLSRWSDRDPIETLAGPTLGTLASIYERRLPARLTGNAADGGAGIQSGGSALPATLGFFIEQIRALKIELTCQRDAEGGESLRWFTAFHEGILDDAMAEIAHSAASRTREVVRILRECNLIAIAKGADGRP